MTIYGLLGRSLTHSFSQGYFQAKFKALSDKSCYINFELENIEELKFLVDHISELRGLNVTIPYKETVIPMLDELSNEAQMIGAVNVIEFRNGRLIGHNTDYLGFNKSLHTFDLTKIENALVLGSGGASKAVVFGLKQLGITAKVVSSSGKTNVSYQDIGHLLDNHQLIVNCTPLGTFPNVSDKPHLSYHLLTDKHFLFDLVYNPEKTAFLKQGALQGCQIKNGHDMLIYQAEAAWEIWNRN